MLRYFCATYIQRKNMFFVKYNIVRQSIYIHNLPFCTKQIDNKLQNYIIISTPKLYLIQNPWR